ncbi:MAG: hypothetical protein JKY19_02065 [Alcanivoracaceae bacterium]|nr:hypothetical protein [Alcanivoracaceae bacterium]
MAVTINGAFAHPHHHSLAILDYNIENKQLELSFKILSEDYKKLAKSHKVEEHIAKHLKISLDTHELNANFQGQEVTFQYTWLYFTYNAEISALENNSEITIYNSVLLNINENQFNTVKLNMLDQHFSHNFSSAEKKHTFIMQ